MRKYFSNEKEYYLMDVEDAVSLFYDNFNEDDLVRIKKKSEYEIPENENAFFIETSELYQTRDVLKKYLYDMLGIEDKSNDRAAKFEEKPEPTPEQKEQHLDDILNFFEEYLTRIDKVDDLSYEDENGIKIKFHFKDQQKEEKIEFGEKVTVEPVDSTDISYKEKKLLEDIKKNVFFRNMSKEIDKVEIVQCDAVDSENYCFRIPLRDTNLILKQEEVEKYLEKYKENEIDYRPKIDDGFELV